MSDQADLERRYRRLLAWYPRSFRNENGQELLAVLMACARDGQRRPGPAGAANLIANGLWLRVRPGMPRSARTVRAAIRLMCAGALVNALYLVVALGASADERAYHLEVLGHHLTAAQIGQLRPLIIALVVVVGLAVAAVWLWLARAVGQGRSWARNLSTVLFGLATLELASSHDIIQALWIMPTWLAGAAAVWLLWRPASTSFFKPQGLA